MSANEMPSFADIPDPVRAAGARPPPEPRPPSEPSPTREQSAKRRWIAAFAGIAWIALGVAAALGVRPDLPRAEVIGQLVAWTLALPVGLSIALRPRKDGWPAGVLALRLGLVLLIALFVGLASIPIQGVQVAASFRTIASCLAFALLLALPASIGAALVLRHTFLSAPALRGALVGAVCGLAGSVGIHSHCPVVTPSHVLLAHGLPIVVFGLAGALFGARAGRV